MAMTRYAGRFVAPTRVSRMRTAKWWIPLCGWVTGSLGLRFVDRQHSVEFDLIIAGRRGEAERPDLGQDIARVVGKVRIEPEELDDGADVHERLVPGALSSDLERAHVRVRGAERLAGGVRLQGGGDVVGAEAED